ncbi:TPA: DUF1819 family protein, partial [Escherichia coli]|nr:DUF1819 family protein [Escherichia coli]
GGNRPDGLNEPVTIITGLLLQELDEAAWDKAMYKENVLQKRTQSTVRRISSALRKRLEHLSSDFWAFAFLC